MQSTLRRRAWHNVESGLTCGVAQCELENTDAGELLFQALSKVGQRALKTVLPDILNFEPKLLNSKSFWYATEDVISEKDLQERRKQNPDLNEELFTGIEDSVFSSIEAKLFANLRDGFDLSGNSLLYDTTNFFTYIEEPARTQLAQRGHNKSSRHHLKQVGLAMCVDKAWGIEFVEIRVCNYS